MPSGSAPSGTVRSTCTQLCLPHSTANPTAGASPVLLMGRRALGMMQGEQIHPVHLVILGRCQGAGASRLVGTQEGLPGKHSRSPPESQPTRPLFHFSWSELSTLGEAGATGSQKAPTSPTCSHTLCGSLRGFQVRHRFVRLLGERRLAPCAECLGALPPQPPRWGPRSRLTIISSDTCTKLSSLPLSHWHSLSI